MFFVDAPGPKTRKVMLERFRLADALEWGTLDVSQKRIDSLERGSVLRLPEQIIFPSLIGEFNQHPATALFAVRLARLTARLIP